MNIDAADLDTIERFTSDVDGWLSGVEGRLLYGLAYHTDPSTSIVEIGSWKGRSTIWLALGAQTGRGARVVAIDPHQGSALHQPGENTEDALRKNLELAGASDVDVIVATSEDAERHWTRPVGLLWIDGDHEYESVKRDFLLWERHLAEGGVVALHDTLYWDGPGRVVSECLERSRTFSELRYAHNITFATKLADPTIRQRLRKRVAVVERHVYGLRIRAYAENRLHVADILDASGRFKRWLASAIKSRRSEAR